MIEYWEKICGRYPGLLISGVRQELSTGVSTSYQQDINSFLTGYQQLINK